MFLTLHLGTGRSGCFPKHSRKTGLFYDEYRSVIKTKSLTDQVYGSCKNRVEIQGRCYQPADLCRGRQVFVPFLEGLLSDFSLSNIPSDPKDVVVIQLGDSCIEPVALVLNPHFILELDWPIAHEG